MITSLAKDTVQHPKRHPAYLPVSCKPSKLCRVRWLLAHPNQAITKALALAIVLLIFVTGVLPGTAVAREWSESKLDKTLLKIEKDLDRQRWQRVIQQGEEALPHCIARRGESGCILRIPANSIIHSG